MFQSVWTNQDATYGAAAREWAEREDDAPATMPRRQPYHRASQRESVRASLDAHLHTHRYDGENGR